VTDRPNVILLTIDALRADRTSLHGYSRPTTPTLERLAADAIVCERSSALGTFTQTASVQFLTSSRPLSHGGYDYGARGRPPTIFKQFHEAGYETTCLSTLHWVNRFFSYGDGVDNEYQLFGINTLPGVSLAMIRASLNGYHAGDIPRESMMETVEPVIRKLFDDIIEYCDLNLRQEAELMADFPDSALANAGYDFTRVKRLIDRHRREFLADTLAYLHKYLVPAPSWDDWMQRWLPREWYYCRKPAKLIGEGLFRAGNGLLGRFDPALARARKNRFKILPDARSLANKVVSLLERSDSSRPFFIWTHFMDTHAPYVSGHGRKWYRETPKHLTALGHSSDCDPSLTFEGKPKTDAEKAATSALYDAAVHSTDEAIGLIVDALDRLGLRENTIVAISGDHGEELGDHGDFGHYFLLYEHNTRVPTLFHRPGMKPVRVDEFTTIMDIAPTLAALAGIDPAPEWEGLAVTDPAVAARDHVLQETFYAGNCLFEHRPLYLAVRTRDHHYLWKEYRDPADKFSPPDHQLYHTTADPGEEDNLYRPDHPLVPDFNAIIVRRLAEIPEVSDDRIAGLFGAKKQERGRDHA
jgi:arylsulfatase A-like enzyme